MSLENGWYPTPMQLERIDLSAPLREALSPAYFAFVRELGAGEGFVGRQYLRLYAPEYLVSLNQAYETERWLPRKLIFGSDGCGQAFAFDLAAQPLAVLEIPFVPLDPKYVQLRAASFEEFLTGLAEAVTNSELLIVNKEALGMEVHEKHPIALGGSPTEDNQVLVPVEKHAELCRFWNKTFQAVRAQARSDA